MSTLIDSFILNLCRVHVASDHAPLSERLIAG